MFSTAPAGVFPLVPTRFTKIHISSLVSTPVPAGPEDSRVAVFMSLCAPEQDQCGSAADWRSPKSGDQEGDGRLPSDKGNRPRGTELSGRRCYAKATSGLHGSWWTLVTQGLGTAHTPCSPLSTPRASAPPRRHPASPAARTHVCYKEHTCSCRCFTGEKQQVQEFARDAESLRFSYWPSGCASHCRIL